MKNSKHKSAFRIIALALGEKAGKTDREADVVALIRLVIILQAVVTNGFIIANAIYNLSGGPVKKQSTQPPPSEYQCYSNHSSLIKMHDY